MLRLYLDANDGASLILCPVCRHPLLLGIQKMKRWVVTYRGWISIRPDTNAMLVCPAYECSHTEAVIIARTPEDAVIYSPLSAADMFAWARRVHHLTLYEFMREMSHVKQLYREKGIPKLPSALRFLRSHFEGKYFDLKEALERSCKEDSEVVCEGKDYYERGRVKAMLHDGVLLERSEGGATILVRAGNLDHATAVGPSFDFELEFDFGKDERPGYTSYPIHTPQRFVVIDGHVLHLEKISCHSFCRVSTHNPETGQALDLWSPDGKNFIGEFPRALIERCYKLIRYGSVEGHRMHVSSFTRDPDVLQLETRDIDVARKFKMCRTFIFFGQRRALRWVRCFHRQEISTLEEIRVPIRLPQIARRR
jgi:hypothetical protein